MLQNFKVSDRHSLECVFLLSALALLGLLCVCVCVLSGPLLWHKKEDRAAPFFVLLLVGN